MAPHLYRRSTNCHGERTALTEAVNTRYVGQRWIIGLNEVSDTIARRRQPTHYVFHLLKGSSICVDTLRYEVLRITIGSPKVRCKQMPSIVFASRYRLDRICTS